MGRTSQEDIAIERRRELVADLYLQGKNQSQIARELGASQSTISVDLKSIRREWADSRIRKFDEVVAIELQKIDRLEREAWDAWERSKKQARSAKVTEEGSNKKVEQVIKEQVGDPRFLEQIARCATSRRAWLDVESRILREVDRVV